MRPDGSPGRSLHDRGCAMVTLIYGRGGQALEVVGIAHAAGILADDGDTFTVVRDGTGDDRNLLPFDTLTESTAAERFRERESRVIVAIGSSQVRREVVDRVSKRFKRAVFPNVIDPSAIIAPQAHLAIDTGVIALQRATITNLAVIGEHCHLNVGAFVGHECLLGDFTTLGPHSVVCGRCILGTGVVVGANSTVNDTIRLEDNVIIGSGSVVVRDVLQPGTYAGNPIRRLESGA